MSFSTKFIPNFESSITPTAPVCLVLAGGVTLPSFEPSHPKSAVKTIFAWGAQT